VSLTALGITRDEDGELEAPTLQKLVSGAEAKPYLDATAGVVYKLFFLLVPAGDLGKEPGKLGKKLSFEPNVEGEFELTYCAALLEETVEKSVSFTTLAAIQPRSSGCLRRRIFDSEATPGPATTLLRRHLDDSDRRLVHPGPQAGL